MKAELRRRWAELHSSYSFLPGTLAVAAILLAADALAFHTPACELFTRVALGDTPGEAEGLDARDFLEQSGT